MKLISCTRCGSKDLDYESGYVTCAYCQSRFVEQGDDRPKVPTVVGLGSDVQMLLDKCQSDPANRQRYASLILDIDPTNQDAMRYLR
jgi:DNA-directed RNA polymerase subunit RPC12/RpoP